MTSATPEAKTDRPTLGSLAIETTDGDAIMERVLEWVSGLGLELYPAQEEALLEVMAGKNVILNTPTGSGKSLVAMAMHFKGLCEGRRSFYTSPIKALVSEKFFHLCQELGAENVGMLTGDASINKRASVICCTAEILSNRALREGRYLPVDYVIMDEFHYYADRDRGVAWQIPLLLMTDATFMLMSATLGDMREMAKRIEALTGNEVAIVKSRVRPVPLDFSYRETPLHVTIRDLVDAGKAPIYVVNFTQRDAAEQAQNLTSLNVSSDKKRIRQLLAGFRFDTPYGKDIRRFVSAGIGLHHAGLLPKYRLLVEQLSQQGLLKIISGTDTLGVGVNIPIRTVLFTKLCKFDGEKVRILSVRNFHQIAGRAGRKGFDDLGSVVCQAPEHVIENKIIDAKAARGKKKQPRKKPPLKGYVHYDAATFKKLRESEPEPLHSQFDITHGGLVSMLERAPVHGQPDGGYRKVVDLIARCHESDKAKSHHRRRAATLFKALREVGIIDIVPVDWDTRRYVRIKEDLQLDFSLHHALSLWLVDTLDSLDRSNDDYSLDVMTLVEAILESPRVLLLRQIDKLKGDLVAQLKAQGVEYEERMEELAKVTHPKPNADFIYQTFDAFRETRPWVRDENVHPKSIARDMVERYASFNDYVKIYGLQRAEGLLLRYLTEAYKVLVQNVPVEYRTDDTLEVIAYLRTVLAQVDSSLVREWESMLEGTEEEATTAEPRVRWRDITKDPKLFLARVRAEAHRLVKALAGKDYEEAAVSVWQPTEEEVEERWTPERFQEAMAPYYEEHETLRFDHQARFSDLTHLKELAPRRYVVQQTLLDPAEEKSWFVEAEIDLTDPKAEDGPLLRVQRIAS